MDLCIPQECVAIAANDHIAVTACLLLLDFGSQSLKVGIDDVRERKLLVLILEGQLIFPLLGISTFIAVCPGLSGFSASRRFYLV